MGLRAILLTISCIIIGLCLSLYFQNEQTVQTMNWDQYKNLQYNDEPSHSLQDLNKKHAPFKLVESIHEIYEKNRLAGEKTRVMEIESGNGRVLMELKKLFPNVEFYGINKEKTLTFYRRESFILTALKFQMFTKDELEKTELPYIIFQDLDFGARIPYDDNKFDLIFSQSVIGTIKYKFELFSEIMRVLRPGGSSFHTDLPTIHIYSKGIILDLRDALAEMRRSGIDINTLENRNTLRFKKGDVAAPFPVSPHYTIPEDTSNLPLELRRPEMGYNLVP